jgi:hypothetical protein
MFGRTGLREEGAETIIFGSSFALFSQISVRLEKKNVSGKLNSSFWNELTHLDTMFKAVKLAGGKVSNCQQSTKPRRVAVTMILSSQEGFCLPPSMSLQFGSQLGPL